MSRSFCKLLPILVFAISMNSPGQAQTYQVLYSFQGAKDGADPGGPLFVDSTGTLYGTTQYGGGAGCSPLGCGTVFEVAPNGTETVLHAFKPNANAKEAVYPTGGVIRDGAGNLYGTTQFGGRKLCGQDIGCGTVFMLAPDGSLTNLHRFHGSKDGADPQAGLVQDQSGNLYGTTQLGAAHNAGSVYELTPNRSFSLLHSFAGGADGYGPIAALSSDGKGNFYGTTPVGGGGNQCDDAVGCGTIFEVTISGTENVLYAFQGGGDGSFADSGVILDSAGNLYGETVAGGYTQTQTCGPTGCGTVFELTSTGKKTVLYTFTGENDGSGPEGTMVMDASGNLYGTTLVGGLYKNGVIFKLQPTGALTILHAFKGGPDGSYPAGGLVTNQAGTLFGTTASGGNGNCNNGCGTVFELQP